MTLYFIFNALGNRFITFSGHCVAFKDRKGFGAEFAKHLEAYQFLRNLLI